MELFKKKNFGVKFTYSEGFPNWLKPAAQEEFVRVYNLWANVSHEKYAEWNAEFDSLHKEDEEENSVLYSEFITEKVDAYIKTYPSNLLKLRRNVDGEIYGEIEKGGKKYYISIYLG